MRGLTRYYCHTASGNMGDVALGAALAQVSAASVCKASRPGLPVPARHDASRVLRPHARRCAAAGAARAAAYDSGSESGYESDSPAAGLVGLTAAEVLQLHGCVTSGSLRSSAAHALERALGRAPQRTQRVWWLTVTSHFLSQNEVCLTSLRAPCVLVLCPGLRFL